MNRKYLAFDIEIAALIPEDETDWKQYRPLGITCAAIAWQTIDGTMITDTWHGEGSEHLYAARMSQDECQIIVHALMQAIDEGFVLLTHNGVSFDLDILAEESGMHAECVELAMNSVDSCFLVHCLKGFPVGLEAIAKGMGLQGKTEGMSGEMAPVLWQQDKYEEVLAYVQQDVRCTLEVALEIEKRKGLAWIAKSGRRNSLSIPRLLTVSEALQLPEPNTDWMQNPLPRTHFTGWMTEFVV